MIANFIYVCVYVLFFSCFSLNLCIVCVRARARLMLSGGHTPHGRFEWKFIPIYSSICKWLYALNAHCIAMFCCCIFHVLGRLLFSSRRSSSARAHTHAHIGRAHFRLCSSPPSLWPRRAFCWPAGRPCVCVCASHEFHPFIKYVQFLQLVIGRLSPHQSFWDWCHKCVGRIIRATNDNNNGSSAAAR